MPDVNQTDAESRIIKLAIEGDKQAFGQLYEQYAVRIYRYLFFRIGAAEAAEDMTETVFLRAWEALPSVGKNDGGINFSAWLYRIAHNALIDHYRTIKNPQVLGDFDHLPSLMEKPESILEKNEDAASLLRAMQLLDEISRNVLISRFIDGMKPREIARVYGVSEGNVRVIQYRALMKLRELMGANHE